MGDRWNLDRDQRRLDDWRGEAHDADRGRDWRDREPRSFQPRGPVFGERESGASYTGPRYGAGGYNGYLGEGRRVGQPRSEEDWRAYDEAYQGRGSGEYGPDYGVYGYDRLEPPRDAGRVSYDRQAYAAQSRRGPMERASDELASWFGDRAAERRREEDLGHRGRGPQGYRRTDARISEDVHDRLTDDHRLDATHIQVSVKDGEVTLTGMVADRSSKHRAEHLVEDIAGVGHVQNNLRVDPDMTRRASPLGENPILDAQARGEE